MKAQIDNPRRDAIAYQLGREFLLQFEAKGVTPVLLDRYLDPQMLNGERPDTLSGIYEQMILSAQTSNMKPSVIGKAMDGGVPALGKVLAAFDPKRIVDDYGDDWSTLLDVIVRIVKPRGEIRRERRSIWPGYCRCILSAARFMTQFKDAADFYSWVGTFLTDERSRMGLPLLLSTEIDGLGFALSCDFLKELGFDTFPKPDVHLRDIFEALALCPKGADDIGLCKAIMRVARHADVSAYNADKVFWLVGSGEFYMDKESVGVAGKIGSQKKKFITWAKDEIPRRLKEGHHPV